MEKSINDIKVLLVDDDDMNIYSMSVLFDAYEINAETRSSGQSAIDYLKENNDIDVVLMDIQMPGLNGFESITEIRKFNTEIPIIALTAFDNIGILEEVNSVGGNGLLTKPLEIDKLLGV